MPLFYVYSSFLTIHSSPLPPEAEWTQLHPDGETAMADAFAAISSPSCTGIPSIMEEIKYPVKVSPAAVVSTALTLKIP